MTTPSLRNPHRRLRPGPRRPGYRGAQDSRDLIFFTDGDDQFDVAELARFLPEMTEGTDLVIGWREQRADLPIRLLDAWGWKQLVNGLFGYTARDVDCAFKLFRRNLDHELAEDRRTVHLRARQTPAGASRSA